MPVFSGVIPPLLTPLTDALEVDYPSLGRLVEHLIEGGVHGLFPLGTSGEVMFHDAQTRRKIIDFVAGQNNGRLPLIVGAVDATTDQVVAHAKAAQDAGADAVVVTAPFYTRPNQAEILRHFRFVRDAVDIPVVAYDIPICTSVKLDRATIVTLAREGAIVGLKDSSGDDRNFRYVLLDLADNPNFSGMTGSELSADTALMMGAHGVVPGLGNVDPAGYVRLWDAARRGDSASSRAEQDRLCALNEMTFVAANRISPLASVIGSYKTALKSMGVISTNAVARPQQSLNAEEAGRVADLLSLGRRRRVS